MQDVINFIINYDAEIIAVLLAISELLALIPTLKSNSILQLIINILTKLTKNANTKGK